MHVHLVIGSPKSQDKMRRWSTLCQQLALPRLQAARIKEQEIALQQFYGSHSSPETDAPAAAAEPDRTSNKAKKKKPVPGTPKRMKSKRKNAKGRTQSQRLPAI